MAYAKQVWADGEGGGTPLSAARLNTIENGLESASAIADLGARSVSPSVYTSGQYYLCNSPGATSTSSTLGNSTVRVSRWDVMSAITIDRLFAEVTAAGEAGSVFRIGIWNDDGTGKPGALALDAGTIDGTSATVQQITVNKALGRGTYWVGGAVQNAPATQPTIRTANNSAMQAHFPLGTSLPTANITIGGWIYSGMSGALGAITSPSIGGGAPRIGFRIA